MSFHVVRSYRFPLTATATAYNIDARSGIFDEGQKPRVVLSATICGHALVGGSDVVASAAVDGVTKQYPAKQIECLGGKLPVDFYLEEGTHISVVRAAKDERGVAITADGEITVQVGY